MVTAVKDEDLGVMSPQRMYYSEQVISKLAPVLNRVHQLNHSKRFWMLITEEYIRAAISRKEIMEKEHFVGSPGLYPVIDHTLPGGFQKFKRGAGKLLRQIKDRKQKEKIHQIIGTNDVLWSGFHGIHKFLDETGGAELPDMELAVVGPGDRKLRDRLEQIAEEEKDPFMKHTILCTPKLFVEHFRKLYDSVKIYDAEAKTFHVMGKFKFGRRQLTLARYIEEGAKLIWYQDGAFIGEVQHKYSRYLAHSVADEYRTWGWMLTDKDQPGPAWFLEKFRHAYKQADVTDPNDLLICFPKLSSSVRDRLLHDGGMLFRKLDESRFSSVRVRPQPSSTVKRQGDLLRPLLNNSNAILSDADRPMAEEVALSRCVIQMSVPATNFLECIYMDHPTMGILNNDQPTDLIKPWYKFLEQKGILYSNAESLADRLNHLAIEEWWERIVETEEYQEFKYTFARRV